MPKFLFTIIKRIIHQKDLNYLLKTYGHLRGIGFINGSIEFLNLDVETVSADKVKDKGRFVFAANHPLGGLEGMALTKILVEKFGDVRVPVNDILLSVPNFDPHFIPINKHGASSRDAIREFDKNYASDIQMLMFPAGMVSRKVKGKITDLEWKKTFITKAIQHKRDIVPVFVEGRNSNLFYNLGVIRKFFGVKANLEMFLLPHETFSQRNKTIKLFFAEPVPYTFFDKRMSAQEWATEMKNYVYQMAAGSCEKFETYIEEKLSQKSRT